MIERRKWRPIKDAPCHNVLMKNPDGRCFVGYRDYETGQLCVSTGVWTLSNGDASEATGWMPLPR